MDREKQVIQIARENIVEKELHPISGMVMLIVNILGVLICGLFCIISPIMSVSYYYVMYSPLLAFLGMVVGVIGIIVFCIMFGGLRIVNPNEALVLTLFGKYHGTIKKSGFYFVNPFSTGFNPTAGAIVDEGAADPAEALKKGKSSKSTKTKGKKVSTKTMTLNNSQQKVNDVQGNPVIIGSVVIWRVTNPTMAVFNVENYFEYLSTQCDSIIRNTARLYPYDSMDLDDDDELTLRGSSLEIAENMKRELQKKTVEAGIEIMEVRITHLAYSEEIAAAMLKRQQASATIAAKEKIVEGAVGMVRMALDKLEEDELIVLDDERKAAMVSNLLVVLCGDREAQPVVNSGSIY